VGLWQSVDYMEMHWHRNWSRAWHSKNRMSKHQRGTIYPTSHATNGHFPSPR